MALPTVNARQLHLAQLSPGVRRVLKERAKREKQREYAPTLAADRRAFGAANQEYGTQVQSIKAAAGLSAATIHRALAGLRSSGLSGRYLRQTANELTARAGDAATGVVPLMAEAASERTKANQEAQQKLLEDQAAMHSDIAGTFNSSLQEERNAASSYPKENAPSPKSLKNASLAVETALDEWRKNVPAEIEVNGVRKKVPLQQVNPLTSKEDWLKFAKGIAHSTKGADLSAVMTVIERLRKHLQAAGPYRSQSSVPSIKAKTTRREHRPAPPYETG